MIRMPRAIVSCTERGSCSTEPEVRLSGVVMKSLDKIKRRTSFKKRPKPVKTRAVAQLLEQHVIASAALEAGLSPTLPHGWTSKDAISVAISLVALTVSVGNVYIANSTRESVAIRAFQTYLTHTMSDPKDLTPILVPLVLVNTGNRDAMIVHMLAIALNDASDPDSGGGGVGGGELAPMLLKPGEIKLLHVPMEPHMVVAAAGKTVQLDISTVDSSGRLHARRFQFADLEGLKNPMDQDVAVVKVRAVNEPLLSTGSQP